MYGKNKTKDPRGSRRAVKNYAQSKSKKSSQSSSPS